jgi:hypothetical protein
MTTSSHERTDVYAAITDQIIAAIEAGADNPQMPWHSQSGLIERPINVSSGKAYRGVNTVALWASAYCAEYTHGLWGTYRQWQDRGAQVRKGEKLTMEIPIVLVGDAPALKGKGRVMTRGLNNLSITSLPEKVPPQIEVDVTILKELEDSIHVRDLKLDADIIIHNDPSQLVAKVSEIVVKAEEERPAAAAAAAESSGE